MVFVIKTSMVALKKLYEDMGYTLTAVTGGWEVNTAVGAGAKGDKGDPGTTDYTQLSNKPTIPTALADLTGDATHRTVTETEKSGWDGKSTLALGATSSAAYAGDKGKTAYDHSQAAHAPSGAQVNADITKAEIEAKLTGAITTHTHAYVPTPPWAGKLIGAYGDCDPNELLRMMLHNPLQATPTNITATVARCAYFRPAQAITVNKVRFFGVGATTTIYQVAIYNADTLARLYTSGTFSTSAQTWGSVGSNIGLSLSAGQLYLIAVSVNTTGTTAGVGCFSATTGRIGVLPKSWPGNLDIDLSTPIIDPVTLAQFTITGGTLPDPAATIALQAAWTGGMPAIFLDNNNA